MPSKYKTLWEEELKNKKFPDRYTGLLKIDYEELKNLKNSFNKEKGKLLIKELIDGKVLLVKNAFSKELVLEIKNKTIQFWKNNPNTFQKMVEGCPDFHRIITPDVAKNYAVGAVRHTTYFFNWNSDPCGFNEKIYERWRYSKYLAGLDFYQYEKNTPKNGAVDRIQIVCYPPKYGGVEVHKDTNSNSSLAISCNLSSKKNKDFSKGGFYCIDNNGKKIDLEDEIDSGDISLYCPTIDHGVECIDNNERTSKDNYDWNSGIGRWWMGLFTNDSNMKLNRKTSLSLDKYHSDKLLSESK